MRNQNMEKSKNMKGSARYLSILAIVGVVALVFGAYPALAATAPTLGAVGSYSILAGSIVTNTGPTTMPGDLGISPSIGVSPHYTGFPPGIVGPSGTIHDADANAAAAQAANTAAFGALAQVCTVTYPGAKDLVGLTLVPGVYCADAFTLSGTLTLNGSGVWIFKSSSTLITSGTANVVGGDPCNVWWRVGSSATLGTNTQMIGNILALTSIDLQSGATLEGRALAQTGAVTTGDNTITGSACLTPPPNGTATATATVTVTGTPTGTFTSTPTVTATGTATGTLTATPTVTATGTATGTLTATPTVTTTGTPPPPVPELPTLLLVSTGILGLLGFVLWRKRKN